MAKHSKEQVLIWADDYQRTGGHGLIVEMLREYAALLPEQDPDVVEQMVPDWSKAPTWARFWAVDFDGVASWVSHKPDAFAGRWCYQRSRTRQHDVAGQFAVNPRTFKQWDQTLVTHPDMAANRHKVAV